MRNGFLSAALYALVAMVLVLLLDFRNFWHTVLALAPLAMGVVCLMGMMGLLGVPLNPANMIALPLILGVGADNGVHILHDYLSRDERRPYALSLPMGRGVMVAALTTILGFGTLMISHHRGLASLGLVLALGVTCCMLTALVFLPAVLRLLSTRRAPEGPAIVPFERKAA
jgi:predicted RND superfamily exporter protein